MTPIRITNANTIPEFQQLLVEVLPEAIQQFIFNEIHRLNGSPPTDNPIEWGRRNVFVSQEILSQVLDGILVDALQEQNGENRDERRAFNRLPLFFRNEVYRHIYLLNGSPETHDHRWGENHVFDDEERLRQALGEAIAGVIPRDDLTLQQYAFHLNLQGSLLRLLQELESVTNRQQTIRDLFWSLPILIQEQVFRIISTENLSHEDLAWGREHLFDLEVPLHRALERALLLLPLEQHFDVLQMSRYSNSDPVMLLRAITQLGVRMHRSVVDFPDPAPPAIPDEARYEELFSRLNGESAQNYVYASVYYRHGAPQTEDCHWGRTHLFDNFEIFKSAMLEALMIANEYPNNFLLHSLYLQRNPQYQAQFENPDLKTFVLMQHASERWISFPIDARPAGPGEEVQNEELRRHFWALPIEFKNHVYAAIYQLNNERDSRDPEWGKNHVFDREAIFAEALNVALHKLPLPEHAMIHSRIRGQERDARAILDVIRSGNFELHRTREEEPDFLISEFSANPTDEEFREAFNNLPEEMRDYIYEAIYYYHGSPETDDPLAWGREHTFDEMTHFYRALRDVLNVAFPFRRSESLLTLLVPRTWDTPEFASHREVYLLRNPIQAEIASSDWALSYAHMRTIALHEHNIPQGSRPFNRELLSRLSGVVPYDRNDIPDAIQARADEIRSLLQRVSSPEIPSDMRDPIRLDYMEIPVFDASHRLIYNDVNNLALRHTLDHTSMEQNIAGENSNCPICRNLQLDRETLMIDVALQERILNHLQTLSSEPAQEVQIATTGAAYIADAIREHLFTLTEEERLSYRNRMGTSDPSVLTQIATWVVRRALRSEEPLTPNNTPPFMHSALGILEPVRIRGNPNDAMIHRLAQALNKNQLNAARSEGIASYLEN
ncbi:MAG: hypothetical protein JSS61_02795 [Verrucomicrobia bacterium]|nr:hypothetical protein [Verrucomicrobiota bacterium]